MEIRFNLLHWGSYISFLQKYLELFQFPFPFPFPYHHCGQRLCGHLYCTIVLNGNDNRARQDNRHKLKGQLPRPCPYILGEDHFQISNSKPMCPNSLKALQSSIVNHNQCSFLYCSAIPCLVQQYL